MAKVMITLPNGTRMEIDPSDVAEVVSDLNARRVYGKPKAYSKWVLNIEATTPRSWLRKFKDGPVSDPTITALVAELATRGGWSH